MSDIEILKRRAVTFPMFPVQGTPSEQEAFIDKFVRSILRMRQVQKDCEAAKMTTIKLSGMHEVTQQPQKIKVEVRCKAVNMNNVPCKFKATCGQFCKKHQISKKDLDLL